MKMFAVIFVLTLAFYFANGGLASDGLHVCIGDKTQVTSYSQSYRKSHQTRTTTQCGVPFYRCTKLRTVYRIAYRTLYRQEFTLVYHCCKGWAQKGVECPIPVCSQTCVHGNCTAPDKCSCEAGFQGPLCNNTCDPNFFGPGCNTTCQCQNGAVCDHRDGTCACVHGWHGKHCDLPCTDDTDHTLSCNPPRDPVSYPLQIFNRTTDIVSTRDTRVFTTQTPITTKRWTITAVTVTEVDSDDALVVTTPKKPGFCSEGSTGKLKLQGIFNWSKTSLGATAVFPCPYGPEGTNSSRVCTRRGMAGSAAWTNPETRLCNYNSRVTGELVALATVGVNASNARNVCQYVKNLVNESGSQLSDEDISQTAIILQRIVDVRETLGQNGQDIVDIVDKIMDLQKEELQESQRDTNASTRLLKAIDSLVENLPLGENQTSRTLNSQNIVIQATRVNISSFSGLSFSSPTQSGSESEARIDLPRNLFENPAMSARKETQVGFIYFRNSKLFQSVDEEGNNSIVNTRVIAASVRGVKLEELKNPVQISLTPLVWNSTARLSCVFWDLHSERGKGNWSTRGCSLNKSEPDGIICVCDHLTSFAALMTQNKRVHASDGTQKVHDEILSVISYVGCAISIAGAGITFLTYLMFKPLRKSPAQSILMSLCVSLILLLIVFLAGAERRGSSGVCVCAAVLLHYLLLTTISWMATEAYSMYLSLVKTLPTSAFPSKYTLRCSVVAWGVPAIIVGITAGTATKYYGNETSCVLTGVPFFVAQFIPACILLLFNFVIFFVVLYNLGRSSAATPMQRTTGSQRLRIAATLVVLLGLTWLFGALALIQGVGTRAFEYCFCIFNSLQGFFIFYFNCLGQPEVRQNWAWFLTGRGLKGWREKAMHSKSQTMRLYEIQPPRKTTLTTLTSTEKCGEDLSLKLNQDDD